MSEPYKALSPVDYVKRKKIIFQTSKSHAEYDRRLALLDADYKRVDPATIKPPADPRATDAAGVLLRLFVPHKRRKIRSMRCLLEGVARALRTSYDGLLSMARSDDHRKLERRLTRVYGNLPCDVSDVAAAILRLHDCRPPDEPSERDEFAPVDEKAERIRIQMLDRMRDLARRFYPETATQKARQRLARARG